MAASAAAAALFCACADSWRATGFVPRPAGVPPRRYGALVLPPRATTTGNVEINANEEAEDVVVVDVAIVGAGLGGLCAGAVLNTLYGKKVAVLESHYLPGGCAHAFERTAKDGTRFLFDSGPTVLLGCSSRPYNAVRQVLDAVGEEADWIPYDGWGMIENPGGKRDRKELRWRVDLGPERFQKGPLTQFGGPGAVEEFEALRRATKVLLAGAKIPAMAMRPGPSVLFPLLRYFPTLLSLLSQGELTTGTFAPFMDGPIFQVKDPWLRNWLDALAFSLSGLPASRTAAAAMAFVLYDMHREGAALDYPRGGMGEVVDALVRGVEKGDNGSQVLLRHHVDSIDCSDDASAITGVTLRSGKKIRARDGVICNAPVWSLRNLIRDDRVLARLDNNNNNNDQPVTPNAPPTSWKTAGGGSRSVLRERSAAEAQTGDHGSGAIEQSLLSSCDNAEQTGSFLHLHLALDAAGLDLDALEAHYTVMDRGLSGDPNNNAGDDGPCGELNMIAVSNPCVLDRTLAPDGYVVVHAYGAGNEPYELWRNLDDRNSEEYLRLKQERSQVLWRAVEAVIPDAKERAVLALVGSPRTHERFLRRPNGTYGSATEDYLKDGSTPYETLVLASDGVFPGIGVPSVCIAGASAANSFASVFDHWRCLDQLHL